MNNKNKVLNKFFGSYYWFSSRPDIGFEEERKRRLFVFLVLPGILVLFTFAAYARDSACSLFVQAAIRIAVYYLIPACGFVDLYL